jgi:hypothetical protein
MHGCTVVARNFLPHARVLADSFLHHNPGARFSVLVVDESARSGAAVEHFDVVVPADLGVDEEELHRRFTMYTAQAVVASLKPVLMRHLLGHDQDSLVMLDADGCIYGDLSELGAMAQEHSVVLSPHSLDPLPLAPGDPDSREQMLLRRGVFNAGLVAVGRGAEAFLDWWAQRTARRCVFDERRSLMLAQTWLTLAPALFESAVLRDRGCNVAAWNMQARDIEWEGDRPMIDGVPLRHFHFSQFDPERPELLATYLTRVAWAPPADERPGAQRLGREYARRLLDAGYRQARFRPGRYDAMPDGEPIEMWMRECYREAVMAAEAGRGEEPPNPFAQGGDRFAGWLAEVAARPPRDIAQTEAPALDQQVGDAASRAAAVAATIGRGQELLSRIGELEGIRDDAVGWAQREAAARQVAERDAAEHAARAETLARELDGLRSPGVGARGPAASVVTRALGATRARLRDARALWRARGA